MFTRLSRDPARCPVSTHTTSRNVICHDVRSDSKPAERRRASRFAGPDLDGLPAGMYTTVDGDGDGGGGGVEWFGSGGGGGGDSPCLSGRP